MKTRLLKQSLTVLTIILLAMSMQTCLYDELVVPEVEVPDTVSFEMDLIPIFEARCNSGTCHATGAVPPDLSPENAWVNITFFGYVNPQDPENSSFYQKIDGGSMTKFATDQDRALILKWIEQGANNN